MYADVRNDVGPQCGDDGEPVVGVKLVLGLRF